MSLDFRVSAFLQFLRACKIRVPYKVDGSQMIWARINREIEHLIVRIAKENPIWAMTGIVGAMMNLGHKASDQTVGNILRRHDIPSAPKREQNTSWRDFIGTHMAVMVGTDFFTAEVHAQRIEDILCAVLPASREQANLSGRCHASPRSGVDGADGSQCHDGRNRLFVWQEIFAP
jgi:hypothetical protein